MKDCGSEDMPISPIVFIGSILHSVAGKVFSLTTEKVAADSLLIEKSKPFKTPDTMDFSSGDNTSFISKCRRISLQIRWTYCPQRIFLPRDSSICWNLSFIFLRTKFFDILITTLIYLSFCFHTHFYTSRWCGVHDTQPDLFNMISRQEMGLPVDEEALGRSNVFKKYRPCAAYSNIQCRI